MQPDLKCLQEVGLVNWLSKSHAIENTYEKGKKYSFPCELLLKWPFTHIQNILELPHFAGDPPSCSSVH